MHLTIWRQADRVSVVPHLSTRARSTRPLIWFVAVTRHTIEVPWPRGVDAIRHELSARRAFRAGRPLERSPCGRAASTSRENRVARRLVCLEIASSWLVVGIPPDLSIAVEGQAFHGSARVDNHATATKAKVSVTRLFVLYSLTHLMPPTLPDIPSVVRTSRRWPIVGPLSRSTRGLGSQVTANQDVDAMGYEAVHRILLACT